MNIKPLLQQVTYCAHATITYCLGQRVLTLWWYIKHFSIIIIEPVATQLYDHVRLQSYSYLHCDFPNGRPKSLLSIRTTLGRSRRSDLFLSPLGSMTSLVVAYNLAVYGLKFLYS